MFDNNWHLFIISFSVIFCVYYLQKINEGLKSIHYLNTQQLRQLEKIYDKLALMYYNKENYENDFDSK